MNKNKITQEMLMVAIIFFTAVTLHSCATMSDYNQQQRQIAELKREKEDLEWERRRAEQVALVKEASTQMCDMLMRKITPATGTNPSCEFDNNRIYVDQDGYTRCRVTLTWDAKTTRFSGQYQKCRLTGDILIGHGRDVFFYHKEVNQAVNNCEASSSWRNEEYFSLRMKRPQAGY